MKNRRRIDSRSAVLKIVPTRVDQGAQLQSTLGGCIVSTASIKVFRAARRARVCFLSFFKILTGLLGTQ
jgi:hypothetical protein